ncbi:MAG: dockerin type I repeat-containing protein [Oscillospiraceae bacterium]|nr:dockerin type I repeat-containing protein [Oscillospiraceae bacterium]
MKKKFFAVLAATVMLHGMPVWADEAQNYTFDELMQMSLEELETLADYEGITDRIAELAANPPLDCENGCISYYILLNEYDKVIPTLWETVTVEDADGRMVDIEQISRDRTAEVLGMPEKALGSIYILSTGLNRRGSEVLIETGLEKADVLEVSVNLNAYGEENICKSYYFATRQLESDENENILNIERIRLGKASARLMGDANCDGSVDVADAVLIARFANEDKEAVITDLGKMFADVTNDGNVDGQDAERILQYIAKKITLEDLAK